MDPSARYLSAMISDMTRLEDRVWARNPEEAALSERREEMLAYLMTEGERRQWRQVTAIIAELRKLI